MIFLFALAIGKCMPAIVYFHKSFIDGDYRCEKFSDFGLLTENEVLFLANFVLDVEDGVRLKGVNKRSWIDRSGNDIPGREGYKSSGLWHYHIGPFNSTPATASYNLNKIQHENLYGQCSGPIIHYKWLDPSIKKNLLVISYSPEHIPFPGPLSKPNHIVSRGGMAIGDTKVLASKVFIPDEEE
jgi:hypothetical protein